MIIANVAASHVLVLDAGDALANLFALDGFDITQHAFFTEITLGQIVRAQRCCVIGWQGDQVVENASAFCCVGLEGADLFVRFLGQFGRVIIHAHQAITVKG